jgi:hypothetical protein
MVVQPPGALSSPGGFRGAQKERRGALQSHPGIHKMETLSGQRRRRKSQSRKCLLVLNYLLQKHSILIESIKVIFFDEAHKLSVLNRS